MNEYLAFAVISLILVVSPGPNSVLILKTVGSKGKKAGMENILGLVSATFVHGAVSILGLSAIILQSAELFALIKYLGAAYLLYLGIKTIRSTFDKKNKNKLEVNNLKSKKSSKLYVNFLEGFFTQLLNPKVSMFYLAAFPQFLDFGSSNYHGAFLLVAIHATTIFCWFTGVSLFVSKMKQLVSTSTANQWFQRVSGGLLVYFSGLLITQEVSR